MEKAVRAVLLPVTAAFVSSSSLSAHSSLGSLSAGDGGREAPLCARPWKTKS